LSRSEPSWLEREKTRRGDGANSTSEEVTRKRRAKRQQAKWERARKEREAIDQKLLEEAAAARAKDTPPDGNSVPLNSPGVDKSSEEDKRPNTIKSDREVVLTTPDTTSLPAPVGPLELLALPNSSQNPKHHLDNSNNSFYPALMRRSNSIAQLTVTRDVQRGYDAPVGPLKTQALPNTHIDTMSLEKASDDSCGDVQKVELDHYQNRHVHVLGKIESIPTTTEQTDWGYVEPAKELVNRQYGKLAESHVDGYADAIGVKLNGLTYIDSAKATSGVIPNGSALANGTPGSPPRIKGQKSVRFSPTVEKNTFIQSEPPSPERAAASMVKLEEEPVAIRDQEHFQLTMEEAFFLSYSLGVLKVFDPATNSAMTNQELFSLFRKSSYFPPLSNPGVSPDDPFMISYVVYHHFRSLGWVVRGGTKFSVDYLLYNRGPVFSHAEFAVLILPSYSDPYWTSDMFLRNHVKAKEKRRWSWMHCINRVISQVKKTLILVYVDIPPPLEVNSETELGIDKQLERYNVREIVLKRWLSNRSRD
jgi:tRNA-splicing endonuclease subunit Sen2